MSKPAFPAPTPRRLALCLAALVLTGAACSEDGGGSSSTGGSGGSKTTGGTAGSATGGRGGSSSTGGATGGTSATGGGGGTGGSGTGGSGTAGSGGSATGGAGGGGTGGGGGSAGGSAGGTGGADSGSPADAAASDGAGGKDSGSASDVPAGPAPAGCTLRWSPSPKVDGDKAFEFLEMPDRNMIHPGAPHLSVVADRDAYRFDSHYDPPGTVDYDRMVFTGPIRNDRLRGEVRGMIGPDGQLDMKNGQTWKTSWSLFIPATLKGTGRFTHIYQLKYIDTGGGVSGSPILTLSLAQPDTIQLRLWLGGGSFPQVNLASLHDRWLWTEVTVKVGPASSGTVHWVLKDGDKVLVDQEVKGTTWPSDAARVRPKWGIYRGITDGVRTTYMMAADYKGYLCQ
jgi:chitin-binding protein